MVTRSIVSYLRFVLPVSVTGVTHATLSLHAISDLPSGIEVHSVSAPWDESTVTFANAPAPGALVAAPARSRRVRGSTST